MNSSGSAERESSGCVSYRNYESSAVEIRFRGHVVSRADGEAVDEEGGVRIEFVPGIVSRGAVLAV
jgi:hypothetical protein